MAIGRGDGGSSSFDLSLYDQCLVTYGKVGKKEIEMKGCVYGSQEGSKKVRDYAYGLVEPADLDVTFEMNGHGSQVAAQVVKYGGKKEEAVPSETENAKISLDAGLKVTWKGSKIKAKWGKVKDAAGYDVYAAYSGSK